MQFDFRALSPLQRYKLLTDAIKPRPIAWVTTLSASGVLNAAPFSFFNAMGHAPPILAIGFLLGPDGLLKDTVNNIVETGEFVVNLVPERLRAAMSETARELPPDEDELALGGLATLPSISIAPPRIAESPVNFECRRLEAFWSSPTQVMMIGEVLVAHVGDSYLTSAEDFQIDVASLGLLRSGRQ